MTDIIDQANDHAQMFLDQALRAAQAADQALPYSGYCHNCDVPLPKSMRFCDKECCSDFEKRKAAEARR